MPLPNRKPAPVGLKKALASNVRPGSGVGTSRRGDSADGVWSCQSNLGETEGSGKVKACRASVEWEARAGTRPAPTGVFWVMTRRMVEPGEGRHKACPYGSVLGNGEDAVG